MKLKFLFASLCVAPMFCSAIPLDYSREELVYEAERHRKEGIYHLRQIEENIWWLPDLSDQKHMKTAIGAIITTTGQTNLRQRIRNIALAIIYSLYDSMYERYNFMRRHLFEGEYHFEMVHFYNSLSLNAKTKIQLNRDSMSNGTKAILLVIKNLTVCELACLAIKDIETYEKISDVVSLQRKKMMENLDETKDKLTVDTYNELEGFYNHVCDLCKDVEDRNVTVDICMAAWGAVNAFAYAMRDIKKIDLSPGFRSLDIEMGVYYQELLEQEDLTICQ